MFKHRGPLIIFFCLIAALIAGFFVLKNNTQKVQDVFSHKDIFLSQHENAKNVLVAGANAIIDGNIQGSIFIVDGDLLIGENAKVRGQIIVLGGELTVAANADLKYRPLVLLFHGHPFVPLLAALLLSLGMLSLILLPLLFWLLGCFFKRSPFYKPIKKELLQLQERWPSLYIAVGFSLSAAMLFAFLNIAWKTFFKTSTILFDDAFIWLVRYYANPTLDKVMLFITNIGFGIGFAVIVFATVAFLAFRRHWRDISALAICLTGAGLLSLLLKNTFQRIRPDSFYLVQENSFSFPSGHAMAAMCFYGMAAFFMMRSVSSWPLRLLIASLAAILSIAIGISRIYLGVHYPTDVAAGYAVGFMWLTFCISLLLRQEKKAG